MLAWLSNVKTIAVRSPVGGAGPRLAWPGADAASGAVSPCERLAGSCGPEVGRPREPRGDAEPDRMLLTRGLGRAQDTCVVLESKEVIS